MELSVNLVKRKVRVSSAISISNYIKTCKVYFCDKHSIDSHINVCLTVLLSNFGSSSGNVNIRMQVFDITCNRSSVDIGLIVDLGDEEVN